MRRALFILGLAGALLFEGSPASAQRLLVVNCDDGELRSWPGWLQVDTVSSAAFMALTDAELRAYATVEISHCVDGTLRTPEARRKIVRAVREGVSLYAASFDTDLPFVPGAVATSGLDGCADSVTVPGTAYTHPIITYPTPDVRGADLSDVGCAVHGSFSSASAEYQTLAVSTATNQAVLLAGTFSCGRVVVRSQQFHSTSEPRAIRFIDSLARWLVTAPVGAGLDSDGDGIDNVCDNCPAVPNVSQIDCNGNGTGDACDSATIDLDHDGVDDLCDSCPFVANADQPIDGDGDGVDDACDTCPLVPNPSQADCNHDGVGDACDVDADGDRVPDSCDNCPNEFNPLQLDVRNAPNGIGDACEVRSAFLDDRYSADVTLDNLVPTANQYQLHSLQTFRGSFGTEKYAVQRFDLSTLPVSAKVTQAFLEMFQTVKVESWINMHFVLVPWNEQQSTWRSFGGAYDPHIIDRRYSRIADTESRVRFNITEAMRAWLSGERPNYGVLVRSDGIGITRFGSRRRALYERRPYLYVDYTLPDPAQTLLVAEGPESGNGMIWSVNVTTGVLTPFGRIGRGVRGLTTAPDGTLYATGEGADGGGELVRIPPRTGVGQTVGPLVGGPRQFPPMPDCTFVRQELYCWSELDDAPARVDVETGVVNLLGGGVWAFGTGLAADRDGLLWLAPHGSRGELYTVDPHTGKATPAAILRGSLDAIVAMTFADGTLYAIEKGDAYAQLVRIDRVSGAVTPITSLPRFAVALATFGWSP